MAGDTVTISDADFQSEVLESDIPTAVDFWAEWCGPCKMLAPLFEKLATEYKGRLKFAKLNVDENPAAPMTYGVRGIPTLIVFRGGEEIDRIVGFLPEEQLRRSLEHQLAPV